MPDAECRYIGFGGKREKRTTGRMPVVSRLGPGLRALIPLDVIPMPPSRLGTGEAYDSLMKTPFHPSSLPSQDRLPGNYSTKGTLYGASAPHTTS